MLEGVRRCYMVLHGVTQCYTLLHCVTPCYANVTRCKKRLMVLQAVTNRYTGVTLYYIIYCYIVVDGLALCYMVLHGIKMCDSVLQGISRCLCYNVLQGVKRSYMVYRVFTVFQTLNEEVVL